MAAVLDFIAAKGIPFVSSGLASMGAKGGKPLARGHFLELLSAFANEDHRCHHRRRGDPRDFWPSGRTDLAATPPAGTRTAPVRDARRRNRPGYSRKTALKFLSFGLKFIATPVGGADRSFLRGQYGYK